MAPRRITWTQLLPGLATLAVGTALAVGVLAFARVGSLRGDSYRLFVRADEARGVIKGTEVWLAGQKVGIVRRVGFRPVTSDTLGRLVVEMELLQSYQEAIRRDSRVEFRAGGTPIGATIVAIGIGSPRAPVLEPGDTLARAPQIDPDSVRVAISTAVDELPGLLHDVHAMGSALRHTLAGERAASGDSAATVSMIAGRVGALERRVTAGRGTLPLLARDDALRRRAHRAAARADSLLRAAASERGMLGKLRNDTALVNALARTRDALAAVRRDVVEERGTVGRLRQDRALVLQLRRLERNLDATLDDVTHHRSRYLHF